MLDSVLGKRRPTMTETHSTHRPRALGALPERCEAG